MTPYTLMEKIERVLDEKVRPVLFADGGNVEALSFAGGVLKVRSLGRCGGCPAAVFEIEEMVMAAMRTDVPEVSSVIVVTGVSGELLDAARSLMRSKQRKLTRSLQCAASQNTGEQ
ncbi:MAG: NifU family protein [Treponema sp.]|jgi:Fe-S cluster biogenesis protein NfuA|nr:NifU family protein [Treponema sp.]